MTAPTASRPYAGALVAYGAARPDVVALAGDLTVSCEADGFRDAFPDRFLNLGMAEQNLMGVAGGLARGGLLPVVHTFGVFATRRPLDQVQMAIALPRARVRIMGFLPGLTTPGGPTHQAIDDVSIMRTLPGLQVFDLADATEIASALEALHDVDGPVYCRVMRGDVPVLFGEPLTWHGVRALAAGDDLCLVSSSVCTAEALRAAAVLREAGVSVGHLHVSRLAPFPAAEVLAAVAPARAAITVENHLVTGGLGSAVAETLAEAGCATRLARLGLQGTYAAGGSQPYLLARYGLDANAVLAAAERLLGLAPGARFEGGELVGAGDLGRQEAL